MGESPELSVIKLSSEEKCRGKRDMASASRSTSPWRRDVAGTTGDLRIFRSLVPVHPSLVGNARAFAPSLFHYSTFSTGCFLNIAGKYSLVVCVERIIRESGLLFAEDVNVEGVLGVRCCAAGRCKCRVGEGDCGEIEMRARMLVEC